MQALCIFMHTKKMHTICFVNKLFTFFTQNKFIFCACLFMYICANLCTKNSQDVKLTSMGFLRGSQGTQTTIFYFRSIFITFELKISIIDTSFPSLCTRNGSNHDHHLKLIKSIQKESSNCSSLYNKLIRPFSKHSLNKEKFSR